MVTKTQLRGKILHGSPTVTPAAGDKREEPFAMHSGKARRKKKKQPLREPGHILKVLLFHCLASLGDVSDPRLQ